MTFDDTGKSSKVFYSSVGTTSNKDIIDGFTHHLFTFFITHILQRLLISGLTTFNFRGIRNGFSYAHTHTWIGSKRNHRINFSSVVVQFLVKYSIFVCVEGFPIRHGFIPISSFRGKFSAFDVVKCLFIWSNHSTTSSHFDTEVTNGHSTFHA